MDNNLTTNDTTQLFRKRLEKIREFEWTDDDSLKIWSQEIKPGEDLLDCIARHMTEAITKTVDPAQAKNVEKKIRQFAKTLGMEVYTVETQKHTTGLLLYIKAYARVPDDL